jgi:hypothetical protein
LFCTSAFAESWAVLKISRVQVKAKKIDGSTWDPREEKAASNCGLLPAKN